MLARQKLPKLSRQVGVKYQEVSNTMKNCELWAVLRMVQGCWLWSIYLRPSRGGGVERKFWRRLGTATGELG